MMACTSPLLTVRSRPLRISRPSTITWRFLTSSIATFVHPYLQTEMRDDLGDQLALLGRRVARLAQLRAPKRFAADIDLALLSHHDGEPFREMALLGPLQQQAPPVERARDAALLELAR